MAARLFCKTGELSGTTFSISADASIGRDSGNEIQLSAEGIEDAHARIYLDSNTRKYVVEAVAGKGLRVDDMDVQTSFCLDQLNIITLGGRYDFVFQVMDQDWVETSVPSKVGRNATTRSAARPEEDAGMMTRVGGSFQPLPAALHGQLPGASEDAPVEDDPMMRTRRAGEFVPVLPNLEAKKPPIDQPSVPVKQDGEPILSVAVLNGIPEEFQLKPGRNVVGRSADCDVPIEATSLSRQHAAVLVQGHRVTIQDLGSKNGTFVDDERIEAETEITAFSSVRLGHSIEVNLLFR